MAILVATLVVTLVAILVATRVAVTLVATLQGEVPQLLLSSQAPGLIMEEEDLMEAPMEGPMEAHMEGAPMVHTLLGLLVLCVGELGRVRIIGWLKYSPQILKQSLNIEQLIRKAFDASIEQSVIYSSTNIYFGLFGETMCNMKTNKKLSQPLCCVIVSSVFKLLSLVVKEMTSNITN